MNTLLIAFAIVLTGIGHVQAETPVPKNETVISENGEPMPHQIQQPFVYYHRDVGIPLAQKIYKTEMAMKAKTAISEENIEERIADGVVTPLGLHPYLVGMIVYLDHDHSYCGGSMLSNTKTLTAAHCCFDGMYTHRVFELVFGSNFLYYGGHRIYTSNVVTHEYYTFKPTKNDIALITHEFVAYNDVIKNIALPVGDATFAGSWGTAIGYGWTHNEFDPRGYHGIYTQKRHATLQVIDDAVCEIYFPIRRGAHICTVGTPGAGLATCGGDSGGPLSLEHNGVTVLIGVTSFGFVLCDMPPYLSAFTRVTHYVPWITSRL